uniref:DUF5017 domain-containing protein n=1 Tax=Pedobacter schmidteae TaxID=2201271 RepID=UPI000EB24623|nr:DUF5017 domain-containing protein [Pedobacter schmidteae]
MKYIFNFLIIAGVCLSACKKELTTEAPTVNIALTNARSTIGDTLVFKLGDTCKFALTGYADNIAFWAGTVGNKYEYRTRANALGKTILSFTSTLQFGTQANSLQVLATNKLPARDSATIVNAAWTNITNRVALASNATAVNSGNADLSDLVTGVNDSLFIAFKFMGVTGSTQRTWTITNYAVNNVLPDFTFNLGAIAADANFWTRFGNVWSTATSRWVASTASLKIDGGNAAAPSNTSWIVSKALYVGRISPDISTTTVKNITASAATAYTFKYAATGKYKASFAVFNVTPDNNKSALKEFNIKIIP